MQPPTKTMIPRRPRIKTPAPQDAPSEAGSAPSSPEREKEVTMVLVPQPPAKKPKKLAPQAAVDEFWAKFTSKTPGIVQTVLPQNVYARKASEAQPKGTIPPQNAVKSYEEAAQTCKDKVAKIVKECRRVNQKYRDPHFDIEFDLKWGIRDCLTMLEGKRPSTDSDDDDDDDDEHMWMWDVPHFSPGSVKRVGDIFEKPEFFKEGATANDIRQGQDGDCWFMAALCTLGNKADLIPKICVARDEQVGVYGFVFHRDGDWISEIVDDKLYLTKPDYDASWIERNLIEDRQRINSEEDYRKIYQTGSGALYFAQCEDPNETWLPLLEKAFAKAHGDYASIEGGFTGEGLEDLTGGVTTEIFSTDILDKEYFWKEELLKVNKEFLFGCAAGIFGGRGYRKGIYEGHAYSILKAVEMDGQRLVLVRNPWGKGEWHGPWSDGSKEWTPEWMQKLGHRFGDDGSFWMSYDDLLKKYQTFDRTRLFTDEWKVTQQWTSLNVPWTVGYHDTEFHFTLEIAAPVVIVLSSLDDRYFRGLEGQYRFELSFRVHKAGEKDYIVRSHGNYWMRRSVTAELELEAGEYHVLMQVEAQKIDSAFAVEDVLRTNVKERRNKLMRIGLAYDMAMAKGRIIESDEEKKARKAYEKAQKAKELKAMKDKMMKDKRREKHEDNKKDSKRRILTAKMKRKEKEQEKKKAAKQKAREGEAAAKADAEKAVKSAEDAKKEDVQTKISEEIQNDEVAKADPKTGSASEVKDKAEPSEASKEEPPKEEPPKEEPPKEEPPKEEPPKEEPPKAELHTEEPLNEETKEAPREAAPEAEATIEQKVDEAKTEPAPASKEQPAPTSDLPPPPPLDSSSDDEDLSDFESVVSDISSYDVKLAIKQQKLDAAPPAPPAAEEPEDEFEKDPWNAVVVVGLRVYCKGSGVTVEVHSPRTWGIEEKDKSKDEEEKEEGEAKLDVDDSAAHAVDTVVEKVEAEKAEGKEKSKGSEGSVVVV